MRRREWDSSTAVLAGQSYVDATSAPPAMGVTASDPYVDVAAAPISTIQSRHLPPPQHAEELYQRYRQPSSNRALRSYNERNGEAAAGNDGLVVDVTPSQATATGQEGIVDVTPPPRHTAADSRAEQHDDGSRDEREGDDSYVVGETKLVLRGPARSGEADQPSSGSQIVKSGPIRGPLLQPPAMMRSVAQQQVDNNTPKASSQNPSRRKLVATGGLTDENPPPSPPPPRPLPVSPERCDRYLVEWLFVYQQEQHERNQWEGREAHRRQLLVLEHRHKTRLAAAEQEHDVHVSAELERSHDPSFSAVEQAALFDRLQSLTLELQEAQQALGALNTEHSNRSLDADRVFDKEFDQIRSERKNLTESMRAMELSLASNFHLAKDEMIDRNYVGALDGQHMSRGLLPSVTPPAKYTTALKEHSPKRSPFSDNPVFIPARQISVSKLSPQDDRSGPQPLTVPGSVYRGNHSAEEEVALYGGAVHAVSLQDLASEEPVGSARGPALARSSSEMQAQRLEGEINRLPVRHARIVQPPPPDFFDAAGRRVAPMLNTTNQQQNSPGRITVSRILHDASDVLTKSGLSVAQAFSRISHHTN